MLRGETAPRHSGGTGGSLAAANTSELPGRAHQEAISQGLAKCQSDSHSAVLKDSKPLFLA